MRYTHIGLEDQARALSRLSWEYSGSESGVVSGHLVSSDDTNGDPGENDTTPVIDRGCHQDHHLALTRTSGESGIRTRGPHF